ncbi:FMN-dependent NADH-azoreductase [Geothrix alkalitolerans]|uniref:FMN-dependent NADH-azoreductase n=1 Tax=Geothrix alkalitolerans TaxID=2922724 RepID=UPI001FAFB1ED|nr:NAD(P)H-dependent oxidoreductase [Geothrix alkalitolerans]
MTRILRIDASARRVGSHSRDLADQVVHAWLDKNPTDEVVVRDLVQDPPPHLSQPAIEAFLTAPEQRTLAQQQAVALSDLLVDELLDADLLVLSVPMYNFGLPSALKAYLDHIARSGRTWTMGEDGQFRGLLQGKRAIVCLAYGASGYLGGAFAPADFVQGHLRTFLGFLGIADLTVLAVEGTTLDPEAVIRSTQAAQAALKNLMAAGA